MSVGAEQRALLTRAAEMEAARQNALRAGDVVAVARLEDELRQLWHRYCALDAAAPGSA
jgi:hypothetical protein